jgi:hypothetical protein
MATWSKRRAFLFWCVVFLSVGVVRLLGDQYLRPIPSWQKLVIAAACVCVIAAIAVYGRRRARRSALPR